MTSFQTMASYQWLVFRARRRLYESKAEPQGLWERCTEINKRPSTSEQCCLTQTHLTSYGPLSFGFKPNMTHDFRKDIFFAYFVQI